MMCVKGLVYRLSHDCHFDIDRDASHCRFSSDDSVDVIVIGSDYLYQRGC